MLSYKARVGGILSLLIVTVVGKRLCFYRLFVSWAQGLGIESAIKGLELDWDWVRRCLRGMCLRASGRAEHLGTKRIPSKSFSG